MRLSQFLAIIFFGALITFVGFFILSPWYSAHTSLLITAKNTPTALQIDYIVNNITYIADQERRANKNTDFIFTTKRIPDTTVVEASLTTTSSAASRKNHERAVRGFLNTIARNYNIKRDLDIRIISRTDPQRHLAHILNHVALSLFIGLGVAVIAWIIVQISESLALHHYKKRQPRQALRHNLKTSTVTSEDMAQEEERALRHTPLTVTRSHPPQDLPSGVPANLPIVGMTGKTTAQDIQDEGIQEAREEVEEVEEIKEDVKDLQEKVEEITSSQDDHQNEPTDTELKERLNKLLRGDI